MTKITVASDYDGYFQKMVADALEKVPECKWDEVVISAGPWRSYGMSASKSDRTLLLDFYSALRTGFGQLDKKDLLDILKMDPDK